MKVQLRNLVFETNSSSTHSLQITKGNVEDAKRDIISSFFDIYSGSFASGIDGTTLTITGLECEYGGESMDIFTIIKNWEAKLQYLASVVFCNYEYVEEGEDEYEDMLKLQSIFTDAAIKFAKKNNVDIENVVFKFNEYNYPEEEKYPDGFNIDLKDVNCVKDLINVVMDDSYVITHGSIAYSSYEGHKINII